MAMARCETAGCVIDEIGKVSCEQKGVRTGRHQPATDVGLHYGRVGIEAAPLSQWLVNGMEEAGLPVISAEGRRMKSLLKAPPALVETLGIIAATAAVIAASKRVIAFAIAIPTREIRTLTDAVILRTQPEGAPSSPAIELPDPRVASALARPRICSPRKKRSVITLPPSLT
jgi:hypothetical protein